MFCFYLILFKNNMNGMIFTDRRKCLAVQLSHRFTVNDDILYMITPVRFKGITHALSCCYLSCTFCVYYTGSMQKDNANFLFSAILLLKGWKYA